MCPRTAVAENISKDPFESIPSTKIIDWEKHAIAAFILTATCRIKQSAIASAVLASCLLLLFVLSPSPQPAQQTQTVQSDKATTDTEMMENVDKSIMAELESELSTPPTPAEYLEPADTSGEDYITENSIPFETVTVKSSSELVNQLKKHQLWDLSSRSAIKPVVFNSFPANLGQLNIENKKKSFLHALLPAAVIALSEIKLEKNRLLQIKNKVGDDFYNLDAVENREELRQNLTDGQLAVIEHLTDKYRTTSMAELVHRVNTIPVSIIMAQGAMESSWGSSRFANIANNIFGIWTWGDRGIVPNDREDDKNHKLAVYDSILSSVRDYLLTLNRLPAYNTFRNLRRKSMDPFKLAEGLIYYSERRGEYVGEIRKIIRFNDLQQYDKFVLADGTVNQKSDNKFNLTSLTREQKISL